PIREPFEIDEPHFADRRYRDDVAPDEITKAAGSVRLATRSAHTLRNELVKRLETARKNVEDFFLVGHGLPRCYFDSWINAGCAKGKHNEICGNLTQPPHRS